ncbi:MAG: methyltransferase family protein [Mycobacteriales bacterium]
MIIAAYGLAVDVPLLARWLPGRPLPPGAAPAGLVVEATGLAWRAWSMRTLGRSYSRTLRVVEGDDQQAVVDAGPYRLIRHPGYQGSLLTWVGFALTPSRRVPVVALIAGLLGVAGASRPRSSFFDVTCPATPPTASEPRSSSPSSGSSLCPASDPTGQGQLRKDHHPGKRGSPPGPPPRSTSQLPSATGAGQR